MMICGIMILIDRISVKTIDQRHTSMRHRCFPSIHSVFYDLNAIAEATYTSSTNFAELTTALYDHSCRGCTFRPGRNRLLLWCAYLFASWALFTDCLRPIRFSLHYWYLIIFLFTSFHLLSLLHFSLLYFSAAIAKRDMTRSRKKQASWAMPDSTLASVYLTTTPLAHRISSNLPRQQRRRQTSSRTREKSSTERGCRIQNEAIRRTDPDACLLVISLDGHCQCYTAGADLTRGRRPEMAACREVSNRWRDTSATAVILISVDCHSKRAENTRAEIACSVVKFIRIFVVSVIPAQCLGRLSLPPSVGW